MPGEITVVDQGRGWQLSTSRITVQDVVPYFQRGCSHEEILRWMPVLKADELIVLERFYLEHQAEMDEQDRRIRESTAEKVRLFRLQFPEEPREVKLKRMYEVMRRHRQERNGEGNPG